MSGPAGTYANITSSVAMLVAMHSGNDVDRACYLTARAALLLIRSRKGSRVAAEQAYALADELAVAP